MRRWQRTHTCGELRAADAGKVVTLNGWVHTTRNQGALQFVDVRDRHGVTQVVFEPEAAEALRAAARELRHEFVVAVKGEVARRLKENPDMPTGQIEVRARELAVLNTCPPLPFEVNEFDPEDLAHEDLRLQYRFLDLRRTSLQRILFLRHRCAKAIRDYLDAQGFVEVETPLLGKSTPEGARDYLVPSREFPGTWYALPQSPQLYKQLLMVAGFDRYFQIARCLRDEDLRANRQPEFTQLDLEMSFVERDDVLALVEGLVADVFAKCVGVNVPLPLPRLSYPEAMRRFGSDKPDLRYGLEIIDLGDLAGKTEFKVFREPLAAGGAVRALNAKGAASKFSRKGLDELEQLVKGIGARGLAWLKVEADKLAGPVEKFLPAADQPAWRQRLGAEAGDLILIVADTEENVCQALGMLRTHLAGVLGLVDPAKPDFKMAWVVDFPLFHWDKDENRWAANHHPFTAPAEEDLPRLESDPGSVRAKAYDLVINGDECGGGSIRIHSEAVQSRVFSVLGMDPEQARRRFGFLLDALKYGAPPHGGIALGLDRTVMMLAGTTNIRDVIAFPKNQRARDLMTGAPSPVDAKQLKELGLAP